MAPDQTATIKGHISRLLDKLEVDNRVQIALLVQAAGEHYVLALRQRTVRVPSMPAFLWLLTVQ